MIDSAEGADDSLDRRLLGEAPSWACFPSAYHEQAWRRLAPKSLPPCADCLPRFQGQMIRAGRCRHPGVVFEVRDGEVLGLIPSRFGAARYGSRDAPDPAPSMVGVRLAVQLFGRSATAALLGLNVSSLPHYLRGTRVLPVEKLAAARVAIQGAAGLIVARADRAALSLRFK